MLKINAIKIEISTIDGLYGAFYTFQNGLNIVKGNNSTGKSTLFQAILYSLGLEELLGGKDQNTMQSVLKDLVEYPEGIFHTVLQSYVYLEIENDSIITIKRPIISQNESAHLVHVFEGNLLTGTKKSLKDIPMYIHDKGGASDETYGFHRYLAKFLGWTMPEVTNTQGQVVHLYLQQIAPSFLIEQKSGWSDFFASMPYYGIRQVTSRVVEFILNMDVSDNQRKKIELNYKEESLLSDWKYLYSLIEDIAKSTGFDLYGLNEKPSILNENEVYLLQETINGPIDLEKKLQNLEQDLTALNEEKIRPISENIAKYESQLSDLQSKLSAKSILLDDLIRDFAMSNEQLIRYESQLTSVDLDLQKNKNAEKLMHLGADLNFCVSKSICPTCHQPIVDSLLPQEVSQVPMDINNNIKFLDSNKRMLTKYIEGQRRRLSQKNKQIQRLRIEISNIRADIRSIKRDLIEDSRVPSIRDIEKRLNLEKQIDFFKRKIEEFESYKDQIYNLSYEYKNVLTEKKKLTSSLFSKNDYDKIKSLEKYFKSSLTDFHYISKPINSINISKENYLPLTKINGGEVYNIRFDSSASDFIRCLWAYYISLMQTSIEHGGNHPNLLIFDEPKQQDMSVEGFKTYLNKLSQFKNQQIIIFASFENKEESYKIATENLDFNLIRIDSRLIHNI